MNYRLLLQEMYIDYTERKAKEKSPEAIRVYSEIMRDLILALDIEPNQTNMVNQAKDILNGG